MKLLQRSLFLVDDHPIVAAGLKLALRDAQALVFQGVARDIDSAVGVIDRNQPAIVVLDLVFNGVMRLDGVELIRQVASAAIIICFSSLPERRWATEVLSRGANAYVEKGADLSDLIGMISRSSHTPAFGSMRRLGTSLMLIEGVALTERETEISRKLALGGSVAHIAADLAISAKTVSAHQDNIRRKLGCVSAKELVARLASLLPV